MSDAEKEKLVGGIKQKGQKLYDDYVPAGVKSMIDKKQQQTSGSGYPGSDM